MTAKETLDVSKLDLGRLSFRGSYGFAASGAVHDAVLLSVAADFEAQVMRKIEALSPSDIRDRYAGTDPVLLCTKYDGESTFIYVEQGCAPFCFSAPSGRVRLGFPALAELHDKLLAQGVKKCLLRAELVLAGGSQASQAGRRAGVSEVIRVSFNGTEQELATLQLVLLDIVMLDGKNLLAQQSDFAQTVTLLERLVGRERPYADAPTPRAYAMACQICPETEIPRLFQDVVEAGGEGVVVRRLNRIELRKIKPHRSVDAVILGFVEGEFEGKYGVASLLTGLVYTDPDHDNGGSSAKARFLQTFVRVGAGLTDAERVAMLDRLTPLKVAAPLPMTDSSGRTVHFIRPRLTAEIHGEDFVANDGAREQRTQLLQWNPESEQYEFLGLTACPRLSFARFKQLREDKLWYAGGARIEQVAAIERPNPSPPTSGGGRIIRREVYTKGEMLRKLVVVEKHDPEVPFPYLVYWTDYSARRAEPLKVSLDLAATSERAEALANALLSEGITKGFVKQA